MLRYLIYRAASSRIVIAAVFLGAMLVVAQVVKWGWATMGWPFVLTVLAVSFAIGYAIDKRDGVY